MKILQDIAVVGSCVAGTSFIFTFIYRMMTGVVLMWPLYPFLLGGFAAISCVTLAGIIALGKCR